MAAVIVLRKKRPDLPRPYRTPGYPVTPVIFILAALYISVNSLVNQFKETVFGLVIILLGVPAYLYWKVEAPQGGRPDAGALRRHGFAQPPEAGPAA